MSVEYDLVIIGYTPEGAYAAMNAALLKARVALVSQNCLGEYHSFYSYCLGDLSQRYYHGKDAAKFGISAQVGEIDLRQAIARIENAIATISEQHSPAILSAAGVDFIEGVGEFCRRPRLAFTVGERKLRSRSYLLAMGTRPLLPKIKSLPEIGYLTPDRLWKSQNLLQLPQNLAIVGGTPLALELAQSLTRLGKKVTLIIEGKILAQEEPEATRIIQAQLEAEGIALFTHSPITQVQKIAQKKWLQVGDNAIETDEIIWAVGYRPNLDNLNLEGLGINPENPQIDLKLQTHHSQIYLCRGIESEFELSHLSRYQGDISLHNALYLPTQKCDLKKIPYFISTDPNITRIGLTERDAQQKYNKNILVYQRYFKQVSRAILVEEMTGFLKIILNRKGRILGATLVSSHAGELINLLTLAIQQRLTIDRLAELYSISPSFSEIIQQTARDWQRDRLRHNAFKKYLRRFWFDLRRKI